MTAVAAVVELALGRNPGTDRRAEELAASLRPSSNAGFLRAVVGRDVEIVYRSVESLLEEPVHLPAGLTLEEVDGEPTWSLLLRAVHLAFAAHLPLSHSPDALWYAIVHEIAVHVRLNAKHYATLFTKTPDSKQTLKVRDDSLLSADRDWVHLICDNYSTHKAPVIERWLAAHPRFHMHFTPTYSSWLNQVVRHEVA